MSFFFGRTPGRESNMPRIYEPLDTEPYVRWRGNGAELIPRLLLDVSLRCISIKTLLDALSELLAALEHP